MKANSSLERESGISEELEVLGYWWNRWYWGYWWNRGDRREWPSISTLHKSDSMPRSVPEEALSQCTKMTCSVGVNIPRVDKSTVPNGRIENSVIIQPTDYTAVSVEDGFHNSSLQTKTHLLINSLKKILAGRKKLIRISNHRPLGSIITIAPGRIQIDI